MKKLWSDFVSYFIRGLVFTTPITVTIMLITYLFNWIKDKISSDVVSPELGLVVILIVVAFITLIGYVGTSYFWKPISGFFEKWLRKIPLVNTVYSSTKDVITSFFGDKKKFDKPVLVLVDKVNNVERLGFITQQDLDIIGLEDRVAVYCPISYSVAGDLIVVRSSQVTPIDRSSSEMMRFLLSGGLAEPTKRRRLE